MDSHYFDEVNFAVTVCAKDGTILEMNRRSREVNLHGGPDIIGKNVLDCHPEPARTMLEGMLRDERTNVYTIEKNGIKKLIYQTPWYKDGEYCGFMELSMEIPFEMPHKIRTPKK